MEVEGIFGLLGIIMLGCQLARAKKLLKALAKGQNMFFVKIGKVS